MATGSIVIAVVWVPSGATDSTRVVPKASSATPATSPASQSPSPPRVSRGSRPTSTRTSAGATVDGVVLVTLTVTVRGWSAWTRPPADGATETPTLPAGSLGAAAGAWAAVAASGVSASAATAAQAASHAATRRRRAGRGPGEGDVRVMAGLDSSAIP